MKKLLGILLAAALALGVAPSASSAQTYTFNSWSELQAFLAKYNWTVKNVYQTPQTPQQVTPAPEQQSTEPAQTPQPEQQVTEPAPTQQQSEQTSLNQFELRVVELTNAERAKAGLAPLKVSEELSKVARVKSADMRDKNYFSHQSPTYGSPFDMMKQFGITYRTAGENIAAGQQTPEAVVKAWMNSDGHRKNIMNPNFNHIGVGYASGGTYGHYWTQQFIGK